MSQQVCLLKRDSCDETVICLSSLPEDEVYTLLMRLRQVPVFGTSDDVICVKHFKVYMACYKANLICPDPLKVHSNIKRKATEIVNVEVSRACGLLAPGQKVCR